ncbi:hypothetical protein [Verrucosispora sp. TAA-831]|uniref:hypothetical protein n=1 Tax=Verrucosispora sp. TAA-831 TaxID=3422227 RepID=UPI003D6E1A65
MRRHRSVAAVVVLLALTGGCTAESADAPRASRPGDAVDPTGTGDLLPIFERPAGEGGTWPDGLVARATAVEHVPSAWGVDIPKGQAVVRVTLDVTNNTDALLPLGPIRYTTVLYGDLRAEAQQEVGYSYDDPDEAERKGLRREPGTQLPVGRTATIVESAVVPVDQLDALVVAVRLPAVEGIRDVLYLTGADAMLKQVK